MAAVRASERRRPDPNPQADERRAVRALTTDPCLTAQPWAAQLGRVHVVLQHAAPEQAVRLAPETDVVVLPMTAGTAQESLMLVPRIAAVCSTPVLLAVQRGCEDAAAEAIHDGAASFVFLPYRRATVLRHLRQLAEHGPRLRSGPVLTAGRVQMDVRRREVTVDGLAAPMPAREFEILRMLLERPGEAVTTQEFLARLWTGGEDGSNSLAVHVRRLRERLEADPSRPALLRTVRGVGYKVESPLLAG